MISLTMDMVQYDCPYIDVTDTHDVSFYAKHWDFNAASQELETRIMVQGADGEALDVGLQALCDHRHMQSFNLLSRKGDQALIRTKIGQTSAMQAVRNNDGYITGPFEIRDGSEIWHVGFDSQRIVQNALSDIDAENEFEIESRESIELEDYYDLMRNADAAKGMLDGCRSLSSVEQATLEVAVAEGYFESPRDATLSTLADEFDVSKTAVSKNLRRAEQKLLEGVTDALSRLED